MAEPDPRHVHRVLVALDAVVDFIRHPSFNWGSVTDFIAADKLELSKMIVSDSEKLIRFIAASRRLIRMHELGPRSNHRCHICAARASYHSGAT
jgi:hypothetical protein